MNGIYFIEIKFLEINHAMKLQKNKKAAVVQKKRDHVIEDNRWDILVIDSDEEFRNNLSELLFSAGYSVRKATNGHEGLEEIDREMPSLVLLVLNIPELNGFDLLKIFRQRPLSERVPIVVISKFGFSWEASLVDADGCIEKPLRPEEALRVVSFLLNKKRRRFFH